MSLVTAQGLDHCTLLAFTLFHLDHVQFEE
jgi:hypothetical protein